MPYNTPILFDIITLIYKAISSTVDIFVDNNIDIKKYM